MNRSNIAVEAREAFLRQVAEATVTTSEQGAHLALICVDVDNFKDINFFTSYQVGDQVLVEIARRLEGALRDMDTVIRIGDDEFAILLPSVLHQDHATLAAHKLLHSLDEPISVSGHDLQVTLSIGFSVCADNSIQPEELLRQATMAMCRAKETRTGYISYSELDPINRMPTAKYMSDFSRAISENQLELFYQPMEELKTGNICGAEVLTRWPHPEYGYISPAEFIPAAEQMGIIGQMTLWTLNSALRQCAIWRKNQNFTVSVNVSARDLLDSNLPDLVARAINTWNVDPNRLTLEITETAMMQDRVKTLDVLNRLSAIGLSLSIDDFGSGYSSLTYLQTLPVNEIKIEKEFVTNMEKNENNSIIVRTVVDLGHNFNLKVIAEGVETQETYNLLERLGCDVAQGYFIAQPMSAEELEDLLGIRSQSSF